MARRLKLTDLRVVARYITYLHCVMKDNHIFYCMDILRKATVYSLPRHLIDNYVAIDVLVCKLMDEAEEQCRKLHTGSIPWSPAYNKRYLLLEYWLMRRSYFNYEYRSTQLIVLQNKLQLTYDLSLNVTKIEEQIVIAHLSRKF